MTSSISRLWHPSGFSQESGSCREEKGGVEIPHLVIPALLIYRLIERVTVDKVRGRDEDLVVPVVVELGVGENRHRARVANLDLAQRSELDQADGVVISEANSVALF